MTSFPELCQPAAVLQHLHPGTTVFIPGVSGESLAFFDVLKQNSERSAGVTFVGVHFPGINHSDYLGLHETSRQRAYFMSPAVRAALGTGRVDLVPLDYPGIVRDLERLPVIDVAIAQVSPPDEHGICGLGVSQDFLPSIWEKARLRVAHVNPRLPRTTGSFAVRASDCQLAFESDSPIPLLAEESLDETSERLAGHVAGLIDDGDTLQFGVGRLQAAILRSLANHRRLRIHSGMVSTPVSGLLDCGAIAGHGAIEAGVALGTESFYSRISGDSTFHFRPVSETHDIRRIAAIPRFCAINSAIEVDLFGQVNGEGLNGRLVAGVGGLPVFAAGAQLSRAGRSLIVLASTADKGKSSRIVCTMRQPSPVALPRHMADVVVTEFGVAHLHRLSILQRAQALIAIAGPTFRDALASQWYDLQSTL